ncbi:hypothetical protein [Ruminiclostridium papyrosolvens]|uniref:Uncharacterized protein n=1 Tax=Ruminiclostridium papyrosolvens C7 TaxID=1330534 RepID=U4R0A6_9FIRM|nr:hypothetical protein [Ruminiclostridium papyrosolvens]EPR11456.1 hypothetical protein L323_11705 [Ruminiclostridium papyrosolvens C7]
MKDFYISNWFVILICLCFACYIGYLIVKQRWSKLRELAYKLFRQAEKAVTGTKKGQERFDIVLNQLYNFVPAWLRLFIPRTYLEQKLQEWFNLIKDSLDDGELNNSVKPPDKK